MLAVSEIYGPVLQGEGRDLGQPTLFLRLMGCNLHCTWCDTAYTWDSSRFNLQEELTQMTVEEVGVQLTQLAEDSQVRAVDISGGEPLLQQRELINLLDTYMFFRWSVETAGTIVPTDRMLGAVSNWNVSPKLRSSGNSLERRNLQALHAIHQGGTHVSYKFVASTTVDLDEVDDLVREVGIGATEVYIMPEGVTPEDILSHSRLLEPHVIKRGYNLTTRLHILLHGNERGI